MAKKEVLPKKAKGKRKSGPSELSHQAEPSDPENAIEEREEKEEADFMPLDPALETEIEEAVTKKNRNRKGGSLGSGEAAEVEGEQARVIYVARIPHGFYEDQMSGFFGQFGTITRLRLSRNKKTGKSKHFAFVEFESPEVAAIVAECMHNYLLFSSVLQCKLVPDSKLHPLTWQGANKKFTQVPWRRIAKEMHNRDRGPAEQRAVIQRLLRSDRRRKEKLKAAGIEYEFEGLSALVVPPPQHKKFAVDEEERKPKAKKAKAET